MAQVLTDLGIFLPSQDKPCQTVSPGKFLVGFSQTTSKATLRFGSNPGKGIHEMSLDKLIETRDLLIEQIDTARRMGRADYEYKLIIWYEKVEMQITLYSKKVS